MSRQTTLTNCSRTRPRKLCSEKVFETGGTQKTQFMTEHIQQMLPAWPWSIAEKSLQSAPHVSKTKTGSEQTYVILVDVGTPKSSQSKNVTFFYLFVYFVFECV